jgi:hypothetical protein
VKAGRAIAGELAATAEPVDQVKRIASMKVDRPLLTPVRLASMLKQFGETLSAKLRAPDLLSDVR